MNIDIITNATIPILGIIITALIIPFIMQKTTKEQRDNVASWVRFAVNAAEQVKDAGLISIPKKDYVLKFMKSKGFKITDQEMDILIEAAVKELNIIQNK